MPTATWLKDLVAPLVSSLGKASFQGHLPPALRVQLNAEASKN